MRFPWLLLVPFLAAAALAADDDLFSGVPKDEFERRAEKFHVERWAEVVEASDAAPLKIPAGSRTSMQVSQAEAAWLKRLLADPALAEIPAEHPQAKRWRAMVERVVNWLSYPWAEDPSEFADVAAAEARDPVRRPFLDYFAARSLDAGNRGREAMPLYASVAGAEAVPPLVRTGAQGRLVTLTEQYDGKKTGDALEQFWKIFAAYAAMPIPEGDAEFHALWHLATTLNKVRLKREERYIAETKKAVWPEWVKLTVIGAAEMGLAWREDDYHFYSDIPDKGGVKQLAEHLGPAREELVKAWQLNPKCPLASSLMIKITRAGYGPKGDTPRTWLDRAVAAQCDDWRAVNSYLDAVRPWYGGSYEELLSFGRACAQTGRFDTEVPTQFNEAVREIAQNASDWPALYHYPELARLLIDTRRKRLEQARGTAQENKHRSALFLELYLVGDLAGAAKLLPEIRTPEGKPRFSEIFPNAARDLGLDYRQVWAEVECQASAVGQEWGQAQKLRARGEYRAAADLLKSVLPKTDPVHERAAVQARITLDEFQADFSKGEWRPLPWQNALYWRVLQGEHEYREQAGRVRLTYTGPFGREMHRAALGTHFELRGKFTLSKGPKNGGVGFMFGHPGIGTGLSATFWWTVRVDYRGNGSCTTGLVPTWGGGYDEKKFPWKDGTQFLLRRDGDKVTLAVEGKDLFTKELPGELSGDLETFGVGVIGMGQGSSVELWDMEARSLAK